VGIVAGVLVALVVVAIALFVYKRSAPRWGKSTNLESQNQGYVPYDESAADPPLGGHNATGGSGGDMRTGVYDQKPSADHLPAYERDSPMFAFQQAQPDRPVGQPPSHIVSVESGKSQASDDTIVAPVLGTTASTQPFRTGAGPAADGTGAKAFGRTPSAGAPWFHGDDPSPAGASEVRAGGGDYRQ
jgi:hypothetical protein